MARTMPARIYIEDHDRIEELRRKLSIQRGGKRTTIADTIRRLIELAEQDVERLRDSREGEE